MKKVPFIVILIISFAVEIVLGITLFDGMGNIRQDTVLINECLHSVADNFGDESKYSDKLEYSVLDNDGDVIYSNSDNTSHSVNDAIKRNDTILDIEVKGETGGKIIFRNTMSEKVDLYKSRLIKVFVTVSAFQICVILIFFLYINRTILTPFKKMKDFAMRVAGGNLDIPLTRDKKNVFGDFTGAFDIMRTELKKARAAEKKAYDEKNEMVAQLSHDIRTPVASIKSTSEIGYEITNEERTREFFNKVNIKADQITTLVDNLFNSSVSDVTRIEVNPYEYGSAVIPELIFNSDHLHRAAGFNAGDIPSCTVYADKLRLGQVFDNMFMNSYKYAGTDISVSSYIENGYLVISISDSGPGVGSEELPLLKNKYRRGSNTEGKDGAGLGLYLSDYYLSEMDGKLVLENITEGGTGFRAKIYLRTI